MTQTQKHNGQVSGRVGMAVLVRASAVNCDHGRGLLEDAYSGAHGVGCQECQVGWQAVEADELLTRIEQGEQTSA